jgi:hypothetical protein
LPKYTGLDIHKNLLFFTVKFEDDTSKFYQFPFQISDGVTMDFKLIHVAKNYLKIYINNEEQLNLDLKELGMFVDNNPCIVFGANSYSHIDENSNPTELHLYEFKLYEKTKLLAHHTFDEFIFNKSFPNSYDPSEIQTYSNVNDINNYITNDVNIIDTEFNAMISNIIQNKI